MSSETSRSLLKLPRELRDEVYKHVFLSSDVCHHWPSDRIDDDERLVTGVRNTLNHHKAILLTCRQIYLEAFKIFYEVNVFHYNFTSQLPSNLAMLLRQIPPRPRRAPTVSHLLLFLIPLKKVAFITHIVVKFTILGRGHSWLEHFPITKTINSALLNKTRAIISREPNDTLGMLRFLGENATSLENLELDFEIEDREDRDCHWHPFEEWLWPALRTFEEQLPGQINGMFGLKRLQIHAPRMLKEDGRLTVLSLKRCATAIAKQGGWTRLRMWTEHRLSEDSDGISIHEGKWLMRRDPMRKNKGKGKVA